MPLEPSPERRRCFVRRQITEERLLTLGFALSVLALLVFAFSAS